MANLIAFLIRAIFVVTFVLSLISSQDWAYLPPCQNIKNILLIDINMKFTIFKIINPVVPGILKTNKIPGGSLGLYLSFPLNSVKK